MWLDDPASVRPMLAATAPAPLNSADLAYERKYDGIRAIAALDATADRPVRLWSRLGNDKTVQFPEVAQQLLSWGKALDRPVVIDGEIVAVDDGGKPVSFQHLQGRMHVSPVARSRRAPKNQVSKPPSLGEVATAFIVFDLLRDGDEDLRSRPLRERRRRLESLFVTCTEPSLRLSEQVVGDGRALRERAESEGWEGLVAKRLESRYVSGRRSPDWRKLKLERRQTCVVGGWTEPKGSRPFFGALVLGIYDDKGRLRPVGHIGSGFSDTDLERIWTRLQALKSDTCPFAEIPRTNTRAHWVRPTLAADVKFTEWTLEGQLRHPTFMGLRDDVTARRVRREPDLLASTPRRPTVSTLPAERTGPSVGKGAVRALLEQIDAIEGGSGSGTLRLPSGDELAVSNLRKLFWPAQRLTKAELFRHYIRVAPCLLPALSDRPLVMKRFPNGVDAKPFYQQRAPERPPRGVRIEPVADNDESMPRLIGGSLTTLLYTVQLAAISQDPWLSRTRSPDIIDHAVIDLDPPDDAPFQRVLDVARWVRDELVRLRVPGFAKLSGAGGLHIYVPMPPDTPFEAGLLLCQIVATIVSSRQAKAATIERSIKARAGRVYLDYLQNGRGKTVASVYSVRANEFAGVSTPVTWKEIDEGVTPRDFTIKNFADRLETAGDLWAPFRRSKGADLLAVTKYAKGHPVGPQ